jgi:hypothetical protein
VGGEENYTSMCCGGSDITVYFTSYGFCRKRPLGRPRRKLENIKIDFREIGWGGMDWIHWVRIGSSGGSFKHGYELSGSI